MFMPVPVAAPSKERVCGRSLAGIAISIPAWGMDLCLLGVLSEFSAPGWSLVQRSPTASGVCGREAPSGGDHDPESCRSATGKRNLGSIFTVYRLLLGNCNFKITVWSCLSTELGPFETTLLHESFDVCTVKTVTVDVCSTVQAVTVDVCSTVQTVTVDVCSTVQTVIVDVCSTVQTVTVDVCSTVQTVTVDVCSTVQTVTVVWN